MGYYLASKLAEVAVRYRSLLANLGELRLPGLGRAWLPLCAVLVESGASRVIMSADTASWT